MSVQSLNEGASEEMIVAAEKQLGIEFPADFRESLKIHNGQKEGFEFEYAGLIGGYYLLSLDSIVSEWNIWMQLSDEGAFDEFYELEDNGMVKIDQWWRTGWIPITANGAGDSHCIDLDPADAGSYGQIIEMWHDDNTREVVGNSFTECFKVMVENLEDGTYFLEEYEGRVRV